MSTELKIGIVGLDTSHVSAFTKLLNDSSAEYHVAGGRVVAAFPGGSPDFDLSHSRVAGFTKELKEQRGVEILGTPEEVAERCDVVFLESVDGRVHLDQFRRMAKFQRPTFIDKPLAVTSADARAIAGLAEENKVIWMSSSALRYAEGFRQAMKEADQGPVIGADFSGPMALQATQPGFFWYGIHTVEMLYASMGEGCRQVTVATNADHDLVVGQWKDGRIGTIRGNRKNNNTFNGVIHREKKSCFVDVYAHTKPYYASLLEQVMNMIQEKKSPIPVSETLELIRFIEAANQSRETGKAVVL